MLRKMRLVPESDAMFKVSKDPPPQLGALSKLERELLDVLHDPGLPADVKATVYAGIFNRHANILGQFMREIKRRQQELRRKPADQDQLVVPEGEDTIAADEL